MPAIQYRADIHGFRAIAFLRRVLPVLFAVLAVSVFAAAALTMPSNLAGHGRSLAATAALFPVLLLIFSRQLSSKTHLIPCALLLVLANGILSEVFVKSGDVLEVHFF